MIIGFNGFLFSDYTWAGPSLSIRKKRPGDRFALATVIAAATARPPRLRTW